MCNKQTHQGTFWGERTAHCSLSRNKIMRYGENMLTPTLFKALEKHRILSRRRRYRHARGVCCQHTIIKRRNQLFKALATEKAQEEPTGSVCVSFSLEWISSRTDPLFQSRGSGYYNIRGAKPYGPVTSGLGRFVKGLW